MMNLYEVARFLEAHDNYDILTHAYPCLLYTSDAADE
mgnify:CR=1 FL=1